MCTLLRVDAAGAALCACAAAIEWSLVAIIPPPGRWEDLIFIVLVCWPVVLASLGTMTLALVLRR